MTSVLPVLTSIAEREQVAYRPSGDPFVSNPYREEWLDDAWVARRRRGTARSLGAHLHQVISFVQEHPEAAHEVLAELVATQIDRFARERIDYQIPARLTVGLVVDAIESFLGVVAGGNRLERVSVALLRFAGERFAIWDEVVSHHGNDASRSDARCLRQGEVTALGESKDQEVTLGQVRQLADEMSLVGATRGFFFSREAHLTANRQAIDDFVERRHLLGQRIVVLDSLAAARAWLGLADTTDADLPRFVEIICAELDAWADLSSRRDWATELSNF